MSGTLQDAIKLLTPVNSASYSNTIIKLRFYCPYQTENTTQLWKQLAIAHCMHITNLIG